MIFLQNAFTNPYVFLQICLIVIFSVCLHEYFHAFVAYREGDESVREHLTLNPLKQMGLMSIIMLALIGIAWGQVPVQRDRLKSKHSMLRISLAGPAANLLLFILSWLFIFIACLPRFYLYFRDDRIFIACIQFIFLLGSYNVVLCLFNLIPAPGLDGWNVLAAVCPKINSVRSEFVKGAMMLIMLIAFFCVNFLFIAGRFLMQTAPYAAVRIGG